MNIYLDKITFLASLLVLVIKELTGTLLGILWGIGKNGVHRPKCGTNLNSTTALQEIQAKWELKEL